MTRLAQVVFGVLVCATVGGFLVAQKLKSQAPPVRALSGSTDTLFSPNGDGVRDTARISFRLKKRSDDVTLDVIDDNGDVVRRLLDDRPLRAGVARTVLWNGRTDSGSYAPDGAYRPRVKLSEQGRTIVLPVEIRLDRTPPRPVVTVLGFGERAGPAVVPAGAATPVSFRFSGPLLGRPSFRVYRTDAVPPRVVASFPGRAGSRTGRWGGFVNGRAAAPGTYMIVARTLDAAGNVGTVPQNVDSARALRGPLPGRAGVTVRTIAVQAPLEPVVAGEPAKFRIVNGGRPYRWSIRRLGSRRVLKRGRDDVPEIQVRAPGGRSGVYLFGVRTAGRTESAPLIVQAATASRVLVVLPAITWQGRNRFDEDGDGVPNSLDEGEAASISRPFATGLPAGFMGSEGALLAFLDRAGKRYDLTTDLALLHGTGPGLVRGRAAVVLAGDTEWLPPTVEAALRGYVERGGRLLSLGTDSLRRTVQVRAGRLSEPSPPSATDAFGTRLMPPAPESRALLAFPTDTIGLWKGSDGQLTGFDRVEATGSLATGTRLVAGAGTSENRPVVAAIAVGRGLVIRPGLPRWNAELASDRAANQLMRRIWNLLEGKK